MSQRELARLLGVTESAVSNWLNREAPRIPRTPMLARIAATLGVSFGALTGADPRQTAAAPPSWGEDWHRLPKIAFAAAGEPVHDLPTDTIYYAFHRSWLARRISPRAVDDDQRLVVVQVERQHLGESMLPTIRPGAVLVVDRGPGGRGISETSEIKAGGIYVVRPDEGLTVKRVNVDGANLILTPDNPDRERYPPRTIHLKARELHRIVVGRVRWIGQEEG